MNFYRCQTDSCRAKWHRLSLEYCAKPKARTTLLDIAPAPGARTGCPTCGGRLEPERGFLTETGEDAAELQRRQAIAAARRAARPAWDSAAEEAAIAAGVAPPDFDRYGEGGEDEHIGIFETQG